jgi:predicted dehydrogenase
VTGKEFECEVPTQLTSILKFESGVIGNLNMSWEMRMASGESGLPLIEIFGTEGQIIVGDPNQFNGKVSLRKGRGPFEEVPLVKGYALNARGLGLAEIASSLKHGTKWQISGQLALHVLEIMIGINQSQQSGKNTVIEDTCPLLPLFDSQCL